MEKLERIGRYTVLCRLGRGGMGEVYQARAPDGSTVAVKLLRAAETARPDELERFAREGSILNGLRHPSLVCALSGIELDAGQAFYAMEYVAGRDLAKLLREHPDGLDPARAVAIALEVLEALAYAHGEGVVHRDVKPSNILLEEGGRARLADFGLARLAGLGSLTRTGTLLGTPEYMSPEQADGLEPDARSDIYALGIVLFEMLSGAAPFRAERPLAVLRMHHRSPVPPLPEGLPAGLEAAVRRALQKEPAARWSSARELADALRRIELPEEATPRAVSSSAETRPIPLGGGTTTVVGESGSETGSEAQATAGGVLEVDADPDGDQVRESESESSKIGHGHGSGSASEASSSSRVLLLLLLPLLAFFLWWAPWRAPAPSPEVPPPAADSLWVVSLRSGVADTGWLVSLEVARGELVLRREDGSEQRYGFDEMHGYRRLDEAP